MPVTPRMTHNSGPGHHALWDWFGLSRAAWLTLPRALMHDMPDDWQAKMAALLGEWDARWRSDGGAFAAVELVVTARIGGRFVPVPAVLTNYRRPDGDALRDLRSEAA